MGGGGRGHYMQVIENNRAVSIIELHVFYTLKSSSFFVCYFVSKTYLPMMAVHCTYSVHEKL